MSPLRGFARLRPLGFVLAGLAQAASIASPWDGQPQPWLQWLSLAAGPLAFGPAA